VENLGIGGMIGFKWVVKNRTGERGFDLSENRERWRTFMSKVKNL
jgi:hypothetical protein